MKLIGSITEQQFQKDLEKSYNDLFGGIGNKRLLDTLKNFFPEMKVAYILSFTPDEDVYFYQILIDDTSVVYVELDMGNIASQPIVEIKSLDAYKKKLSRLYKIQLEVALKLAQKKLNKKLNKNTI